MRPQSFSFILEFINDALLRRRSFPLLLTLLRQTFNEEYVSYLRQNSGGSHHENRAPSKMPPATPPSRFAPTHYSSSSHLYFNRPIELFFSPWEVSSWLCWGGAAAATPPFFLLPRAREGGRGWVQLPFFFPPAQPRPLFLDHRDPLPRLYITPKR